MTELAFHGFLVVDKPAGITSRAAVTALQLRLPRCTKIGHTGTLDPLATGVLVICLGAATRLAEYVQNMPKTYRAGVLLGARSDTEDADGTVVAVPVQHVPTQEDVSFALQRFVGDIGQTPPAYSAAKVAGRRAYDLARRGQSVTLAERRVRIHAIEMLQYPYPHLGLEIKCGRGTYIRSLARDLGELLGCGGLIESLRRTRVGPFAAENALPCDAGQELLRAHLMPLTAAVADLPRIVLDESQTEDLRSGKVVPWHSERLATGPVAAMSAEGALIAIVRADADTGFLTPHKVFARP